MFFFTETLIYYLEDDSYVQKCSIVDGSVQCARIDNLQNMSFTDQRQALDKLIGQYRQQLNKLKVSYINDTMYIFGYICKSYHRYTPCVCKFHPS